MMSIAFKEGLKIPPPALNEVILASNQDIRQVCSTATFPSRVFRWSLGWEILYNVDFVINRVSSVDYGTEIFISHIYYVLCVILKSSR